MLADSGSKLSRASSLVLDIAIIVFCVLCFVLGVRHAGRVYNRDVRSSANYVSSNYYNYKALKFKRASDGSKVDIVQKLRVDSDELLNSSRYIVEESGYGMYDKKNLILSTDIETPGVGGKASDALSEQRAMLENVIKNPLFSQNYAHLGIYKNKSVATQAVQRAAKDPFLSNYVIFLDTRKVNGEEYYTLKTGPFDSVKSSEEFCQLVKASSAKISHCFTVQ